CVRDGYGGGLDHW
nr:immunoglobulin heavy chain junction region [Macaca mulatta]MOY17967.1 immunoglobulin heavy chain junction region [Macaca mulatta]MOY18166.1 immunoglobulin heavy chain junction region [Macaca mulatta]MOY18578.1 immunoglobulin heavy chain junction region [Macaca mulatta]MOY18826.1 immunoglobulin heavy chain junction region [Macaca mulatta]